MVDISRASSKIKAEIADYIREDNLEYVNTLVQRVEIRDGFYVRYGKRVIDIVVSLLAILVTLPVNLLIAVITYFDVGSPILFRQKRTGRGEKQFTIYKFRNMTNAVDANGDLLSPAERVTKWGKFVRKVSLDELLNFVSILRGDMSLVGPRPLLNDYIDRFNNRDRQRYCVKPGLECPSIKRLDHPMNWRERLDNDVWYAQHCSLWVDIRMVFGIVRVMFDKKATAVRSKAAAGGFLGYNRDGSIITTQNVPDQYCERYCQEHGIKSISEVLTDDHAA